MFERLNNYEGAIIRMSPLPCNHCVAPSSKLKVRDNFIASRRYVDKYIHSPHISIYPAAKIFLVCTHQISEHIIGNFSLKFENIDKS